MVGSRHFTIDVADSCKRFSVIPGSEREEMFHWRSVLLLLFATTSVLAGSKSSLQVGKHKLPDDFIYGCGTSAYQIEGAWNEDGKGPSIWDTFVGRKSAIKNGDTGRVAMDFYHSYPRDLPLFHNAAGINTFDHTVAWTRILPDGSGKKANKRGVDFYRQVANVIHQQGMTFSATLYHCM